MQPNLEGSIQNAPLTYDMTDIHDQAPLNNKRSNQNTKRGEMHQVCKIGNIDMSFEKLNQTSVYGWKDKTKGTR